VNLSQNATYLPSVISSREIIAAQIRHNDGATP
jgi:hypothetical protein